MQETDINFRYDEIADEELDALVRKYYQEHLTGVCAYIIGCLWAAHALHIPCHHVVASIVMCKGLQTLRGTRVGVRRVRVQVRIF